MTNYTYLKSGDNSKLASENECFDHIVDLTVFPMVTEVT